MARRRLVARRPRAAHVGAFFCHALELHTGSAARIQHPTRHASPRALTGGAARTRADSRGGALTAGERDAPAQGGKTAVLLRTRTGTSSTSCAFLNQAGRPAAAAPPGPAPYSNRGPGRVVHPLRTQSDGLTKPPL